MNADEDADQEPISGVEAFSDRVAPLPKAQEEKLIGDIIEALAVEPERRDECLCAVRFCLKAAQSRLRFQAKVLPEGTQKEKASMLSAALQKARHLSRDIEPLFRAMFDDSGGDYAEYQRLLNLGIEAADRLAITIIISKGKKPRDAGKSEAKVLAIDLVAEYSPFAGKRARLRTVGTKATSGKPGTPGGSEIINHVASLIYQIFTDHEAVEITEHPDAYAPPTLRTKLPSRLPTTKK
jgi:hypothetical protein